MCPILYPEITQTLTSGDFQIVEGADRAGYRHSQPCGIEPGAGTVPGVGEKWGRVGEGILEERVFLLKFAKDFRRQRWAEGDRRCTWSKLPRGGKLGWVLGKAGEAVQLMEEEEEVRSSMTRPGLGRCGGGRGMYVSIHMHMPQSPTQTM